MAPQIKPRTQGWPRPVRLPSSESASANPMLMPAPLKRPVRRERLPGYSCVANAAAKTGASVETEPSIRPASPGCTICSTNKTALRDLFVGLHVVGQLLLVEFLRALFVVALFSWRDRRAVGGCLHPACGPRPFRRSAASRLPWSMLLCAPPRCATDGPATMRGARRIRAHPGGGSAEYVRRISCWKSSSNRRRCPDSSSRMPSNIEAVAG